MRSELREGRLGRRSGRGERSKVEVADMPSIGKTTVFRNGTMTLYGADGVETLTEAEWMARTKIED